MSRAHHDPRWAPLRKARHTAAAQANEPCWRCGWPIDYTLPGTHWAGPQVDHAIPVSQAPHLAYVWENLRIAHKRCNQRHGASLGNKGRAAKKRANQPDNKKNVGASRNW